MLASKGVSSGGREIKGGGFGGNNENVGNIVI